PIRASLFLAVQASSFLMSAVNSGELVRAKTMATGFVPFWQYRQFFCPAAEPLMLSGWNGPGTFSPTCGPDLTASPAETPATRMSAAAQNTAAVHMTMNLRYVFMKQSPCVKEQPGIRLKREPT